MGSKLPWMKFYPSDWLSDERLRACSGEARGLWIDMLCLMHKSDRRGYLQLNGQPLTLDQLARSTGRSTEESARQLQELKTSGVFSVTEHGVIFSRRMVREEGKSVKCSEAGRLGGNPTLKGQSKGQSKGGDKPKRPEAERSEKIHPAAEPPVPPPNEKDRKTRPRNPLFDAIVEVTGLDPATAGSAIGKAAADLAKSDRHYTPEDVLTFAARVREWLPWHEGALTPGMLVKHIGLVRNPPKNGIGGRKPPVEPGGLPANGRERTLAVAAQMQARQADEDRRWQELGGRPLRAPVAPTTPLNGNGHGSDLDADINTILQRATGNGLPLTDGPPECEP